MGKLADIFTGGKKQAPAVYKAPEKPAVIPEADTNNIELQRLERKRRQRKTRQDTSEGFAGSGRVGGSEYSGNTEGFG